MYVTETRSRVAALDLRTGRTLWRFEPDIPKTVRVIGFGPTNRGVALLGDRVFVGTLNARLVALRWHFQFTPHDTHDWDANQIPVLVDATINGQPRKLVITANRNGFYYVLDRTTGEYLRGTAYAKADLGAWS